MAFGWRKRGGQAKKPATRNFAYAPVDMMIADLQNQTGSVTREQALSVPAVTRSRNLIASIATLPLAQYGPDNLPVDNPLFGELDPDVANVVTLAQTVEDLVFDGIAWWRVTQFLNGFPSAVRRLDPHSVSLNPPLGRTAAPLPSGVDPRNATVWVDGYPVSASQVIRFDSPNGSILRDGASVIRRAILLDRLAKMYADDPRPLDYFEQTAVQGASEEFETDDGTLNFLAKWKAARKMRATGFVPLGAKYNQVSAPSPAELQLVELQKQAALEIADLLGVDAEELGLAVSNRTYFNAQDRRKTRVNEVLAPYMRAILDVLNKPAYVVPRGHSVRFDLTDYMKADNAERVSYYQAMKGMGAMTVDEIRKAEGLPPLPASERREVIQTEVVDQADEQPAIESGNTKRQGVRTFSADLPSRFVALELQTFSVDRDSRVIEGLALPYGAIGNGARFEKGALKFTDVSRVKLNMDHDPLQTVGVATDIKDGPNGLHVKFRVARTAEGDRALTLAEDSVYDGLSIEIPDDPRQIKFTPDPRRKSGYLITSAPLIGVALTPTPAFDGARLTRVKFNESKENPVEDTDTTQEPVTTPEPTTPAAPPSQFTDDQAKQLLTLLQPKEERRVVDVRRQTTVTTVHEALPYRFDRRGNFATFEQGDNVFSADLHLMAQYRDIEGKFTDAGKRVMAFIASRYVADTTVASEVDELNPAINRPDMFVDLRSYRYPIWSAINKGAPPNGIQPFYWSKRGSTVNMAPAQHTEGTEPESKAYGTEPGATVTPVPLSAKASVTREVWDMGGNPAISGLIMKELDRAWFEGLESAAATYVGTLTAATDVTLSEADDADFVGLWEGALADLQFLRAYDFSVFVAEKFLYKRFVRAKDTTGQKFYPIINPVNRDGQATSRFTSVNAAGQEVLPAWALAQGDGANPANSWFFDPSVIWGWATAPQRFEFPGTDAAGNYAPVAMVDIAMWGYRAFANTDIGGVRQVIYDDVLP